ncbi:hypothetical protein E3O42_15095 [Cryobacterium adonitolivorans]|uniref:RNA polymerase sigma factor n=1 Tax=Cryobacterium adonitolivorans TaxID=1259189 RepID=A0A4R8W3P2_9MICO|nr:sigma factor [Cryobacterium adonitolivorans]TFB98690.1 hypothetical protein E3O42_15095 [Cryobacterium adonitolivorans]
MADARRTVEAVWRIESARIVATLAKMTNDVVLAEDLAQEAVLDALRQWPESGIPQNPGAWLTAVAKRKAIDTWWRRERLDDRYRAIAHDLAARTIEGMSPEDWQPIDDDVLRLVSIACHPVLAREAQVAVATGPASARLIVDGLADAGVMRGSALLPSVRGELLTRQPPL